MCPVKPVAITVILTSSFMASSMTQPKMTCASLSADLLTSCAASVTSSKT